MTGLPAIPARLCAALLLAGLLLGCAPMTELTEEPPAPLTYQPPSLPISEKTSPQAFPVAQFPRINSQDLAYDHAARAQAQRLRDLEVGLAQLPPTSAASDQDIARLRQQRLQAQAVQAAQSSPRPDFSHSDERPDFSYAPSSNSALSQSIARARAAEAKALWSQN
ncbi:MAG: hypothetical protein ACPGNV_09845 [Mangrovicoccus sp.]